MKAWRQEARATFGLALPLILTNLAQALIHATDVLLLGWTGPRTLAAGILGVNLVTACLIFGNGLISAASPMIARELGRRSHSVRDVRRTVRQAMWTAAVLVLPFWLLLWQTEPILRLLGQQPDLAAGAATFVRAVQWGLLPAFLYLVLRGFVAAVERPAAALIVGCAGVVFNALVNSVLILGGLGIPPLGLLGAGIGSALANLFMFAALALIVARDRRFRRYHLFGRFWRPDWPRFAALWRLGIPIAVTLTLEVTVFNAAVFLMGLFGAVALAAHAIALQVATLSFMVPLGLAQAATVRVGLAFGRRDMAAVTRAGWTAFTMGTGFMVATGLIMLTLPRLLISAFIDPAGPDAAAVATLAVRFLAVAALFQVVDGAQTVGAGMLRGLHDTRVPMAYAAFGYWGVGLVTSYGLAFPAGMGGIGIWIGLAIGLATVALLMVTRWMRRDRLPVEKRILPTPA